MRVIFIINVIDEAVSEVFIEEPLFVETLTIIVMNFDWDANDEYKEMI